VVFDNHEKAVREVKLAGEEWEKFIKPMAMKASPAQRAGWVRIWAADWDLGVEEYLSFEDAEPTLHYDLCAIETGGVPLQGPRLYSCTVAEIEADRARLAADGVKV
jgi:hypothetical protein